MFRHQLVEEHQGQGPIAGALADRMRTVFRRLHADAERQVGELHQVVFGQGHGLFHAAAVDVGAVGAAQVAEHQRQRPTSVISACTVEIVLQDSDSGKSWRRPIRNGNV